MTAASVVRCGRLLLLGVFICATGLEPRSAAAQLRYDREYEGLRYAPENWRDRVTGLRDAVEAGEIVLAHDEKDGYLPALLRELDVPEASQALVFTKTSLQKPLISPATPRAIYFTDDVYVAWVPGSRSMEVSAVDPVLGAIFYTITQDPDDTGRPRFRSQTFTCLQCHDSYSLTGGGVPRHLMGSMIPDASGNQVFHEGWYVTTPESPLEQRWGGWYVTGTHGDTRHLGNLFVKDAAEAADLDLGSGANVTDLTTRIDTSPYLTGHSDIVALLVLEHQVHVQNLITRVSYDSRTALARDPAPDTSTETFARIDEMVEPLVRAMLLEGEPALTAPIAGTSGFRQSFAALGPRDGQGRSLRDLDLERRLFRYPFSYLVYSASFESLPEPVRSSFSRRLGVLLQGADAEELVHLTPADRVAVREILLETIPESARWLR